MHRRALLLALLSEAACAHAPRPDCKVDPRRALSWTDYWRLPQEPRDAYAVEYGGCGKRLIYIAAHHVNDPQSATFTTINAVFAQRQIQFAIVEGFPASDGISPSRMADYARHVAGGAADNEAFFTVRRAIESGAGFSGGEPDDATVLATVRAQGVGAADLFGYYVLRHIEQWRREQAIAGPGDPALDVQIRRYAPIFVSNARVQPADIANVATLAGFKAWYAATNGVSYGEGYRPEDAYPSGLDTSRATNLISDRVDDARDRAVLATIANALDAHSVVLVVYGASHLLIQAPALQSAFGRPTPFRLTTTASRRVR